MSVMDVVLWVLPPLAGASLGLRIRSSAPALLLGLVLVIASVFVWGYSWNYPNGACQEGEPCPTGDRVVQIVFPILFLGGLTLFLVGFVRSLWKLGKDLRAALWPRQRGEASLGRKGD